MVLTYQRRSSFTCDGTHNLIQTSISPAVVMTNQRRVFLTAGLLTKQRGALLPALVTNQREVFLPAMVLTNERRVFLPAVAGSEQRSRAKSVVCSRDAVRKQVLIRR